MYGYVTQHEFPDAVLMIMVRAEARDKALTVLADSKRGRETWIIQTIMVGLTHAPFLLRPGPATMERGVQIVTEATRVLPGSKDRKVQPRKVRADLVLRQTKGREPHIVVEAKHLRPTMSPSTMLKGIERDLEKLEQFARCPDFGCGYFVAVGTGFKSRESFARLIRMAGRIDFRIDTIFADDGRQVAFLGIIRVRRRR